MQVRLVFFILFLITVSDVFCGRLNKLQNDMKNECPRPEDIPKCRCELGVFGTSAKCTGPMKDSELQSSLNLFQEHSLNEFTIHNYKASSISSDLWKGQNIKKLTFNGVEVVDESFMRKDKLQFQGLENTLEELNIEKSFKSKDRPLLNLHLDHLKKLKIAEFTKNNIPEVGNDWFPSGPKDLSLLLFSHNGIIELGDKAFTSLSSLNYLDVSGNQITTVTRSMFPKSATALWYLKLSNNKLRYLPNDIFSGMSSLKIVEIENNFIERIDEDTWKSVAAQTKYLHLIGNPFICDSKMKWICNIKLTGAAMAAECSSPEDTKGLTLSQFCH